MALEQPNNQPQPMAQRPPVGDGGEAMPNQGDSMPNQQEQEQGQNQEQQIQEFQQRVQQLPPQEKQVLAQSLTPDFRNITVKVFGSDINIFFDIFLYKNTKKFHFLLFRKRRRAPSFDKKNEI